MPVLPDRGHGAILDVLVPLVRAAGAFISAQAAERHSPAGLDLDISSKADPVDFVTWVDKEVERRIVGWLRGAYPEIGVLAEEGSFTDTGNGRFWVLDPLDGTRNFIKGLAGYCVSLALVEDGEPRLGLVLDVEADELYTAIRGQGAYMNGRRLKAAEEADPAYCVAGVGFPVVGTPDQASLDRYLRLMNGTSALRQGGSVARDLALVARGSLDAFWQPILSPWDVAAGMLLVSEAGGVNLPDCGDGWLQEKRFGLLAASHAAFPAISELLG